MILNRHVLTILLIATVTFGAISANTAAAQNREIRSQSEAVEASDTVTAAGAVRRALRENPTVLASREQASAAAASVRTARSGWFPTIRGEASFRRLSDNIDYTVDIPSIPGGGGQQVTFAPAIRNRYSTQATVEQPVFTGFRVSNELEAAHANTRSAEARVRATRQEIAFRTRATYWRLYRARAQRRATNQSLELLERQLTDIRNQRDAGRATEADVLRVQARRDQIRAERVAAHNEARTLRRSLNDLMGRSLNAAVVLADTVRAIKRMPSEVSALVAQARDQRPDLKALRESVAARAAELDVAQSDWYPQIWLTGHYLYARPNERLFPPEDRFRGTWEAGVRLSWSLSTGGRTEAATDRARAQWRQARYELQDRRASVAAEVANQVEAVRQARESISAARTSLRSAEEAYRSVQSRFDAGMAIVSGLLDAERTLRHARAQMAAAQADYALARAGLARALGREALL